MAELSTEGRLAHALRLGYVLYAHPHTYPPRPLSPDVQATIMRNNIVLYGRKHERDCQTFACLNQCINLTNGEMWHLRHVTEGLVWC